VPCALHVVADHLVMATVPPQAQAAPAPRACSATPPPSSWAAPAAPSHAARAPPRLP
jgi:hypothetical protein